MLTLKQFANKYKASLSFLLILNGLLGALAGILTATWQFPIETAQVLLGLVSYDHSALPYMYYVSTFSLINYIGCICLAITHSEMASSILLCALVGSVLQQTLAMTIFLFVRNAYLVTLATVILMWIHFMGYGIAYPIFLLGTEHTFGRIGLFFMLYAALFLAFSKYRTAFLLSGLALGIHPGWGLWLNGCMALILVTQYKQFRSLVTVENIISLFAGVGLSIAVFAWQKTHYPITLTSSIAGHITEIREIFLNYIKYWDFHRHKFNDPRFLFNGLCLAWVSFLLCRAFLKHNKASITVAEKWFFSFVLVSTAFSTILVFIPSWFDPAYFPAFFIELMPGRFIDAAIFLCSPLLCASILLWLSEARSPLFKIKVSTLLLIRILIVAFAIAAAYDNFRLAFTFMGVLGCLFCATQYILSLPFVGSLKYAPARSDNFPSWLCLSSATAYLALACIAFTIYAPIYTVRRFSRVHERFVTIAIPQPLSKSILTTDDLVQFKTRVSTLTPHLDGYAYLGKAAMVPFSQMVQDIFGISLLIPPPANLTLHSGGIATSDFKDLWEVRKCEEWQSLSAKYHFGLILVPSDFHLRLERIANDRKWNKYYPKCVHSRAN